MIFRAVVLCDGDELSPVDFPQLSGLIADLPEIDLTEPANDVGSPAAPIDSQAASLAAFDHPVRVTDGTGELRPLDQVERDLIQYAIDFYAGHMSEVARKLGIGRSTLYRKVREHDLRVKPEEDEAEAS